MTARSTHPFLLGETGPSILSQKFVSNIGAHRTTPQATGPRRHPGPTGPGGAVWLRVVRLGRPPRRWFALANHGDRTCRPRTAGCFGVPLWAPIYAVDF